MRQTTTKPSSLFAFLLVFLTVITLLAGITLDDIPNGEFKTQDGSKCAWHELKKSEDNVSLGIGCHCRNERGSGQGYTCHYFGDPTGCESYTDDPTKFYSEILQLIEENFKNACEQETLSHDRCPGNEYTRREYTPPEEPCFKHKKERYEL